MVDVSTANIGTLKGMPDVAFDFGVSSAVKAAFRAEASRLTDQRGSRAAWRTTGLTDFKGHFSEVFRTNGQTQLGDLDEVATALRQVADKVEELEEAAREENHRRKVARDWAQEQANRNGVEKWFDDHVWGEDDPPAVTLSDSGPSRSVPQPPRTVRQAPQPGAGGGGGGGTSSARPSDLRSFATSTRSGDTELAGSAPRLQGQCDSFATSCSWATLDASGPISGLRQWLQLNGEDATWATVVADAFTRAGSDADVSTLSDASIEAALRAHGVSTSRRDIEVEPATGFGSPPTTGYSNDPVNTATGNFTETEVDLSFSAGSPGLELARHHNSLDTSSGAFGLGWTSWTEAGLRLEDDKARLRLHDGRQVTFPRLGDGWDRAVGENLWLHAVAAEDASDGSAEGTAYVVTSSSGLRWELRADGRPGRTGSGPGTVVSFAYDDRGRLVSLTHERGRSVALHHDEATGLVARVSADDGREVAYTYDERARLTAVSGPAGVRRYHWDDDDRIVAVVDADGVVEAENTFDEHGRVTSQRSPFGRTTRFVYLAGGVTEVSDADGRRSNTWISDARGRLVGVIDADGRRQSTSYDAHGNPVTVTARDGAAVVNLYDERGRRVRQVGPTGTDVTWDHDDADRVLAVTVTGADEPAVTRYRYDGESRDPSEVVDPEGGVTRMRWEGGLLREVVDPEGVRLLLEHDARGDLVATTDAEGHVARLERDALGRVTAAVTPLGHRTTYRYDGAGPLVSRQDPDGGTWRFEHSAAGRLTAVTDPTGGRTEIERGGHGEQSRTIDPLGRALSTAYDDLGNRTRVELPDGTEWGFTYDAMSRLVETADPAGGRWRMGYDVSGGLVSTTDPTGVERGVERDAVGRPLRAGDLDSFTTAAYDQLGRTVSVGAPDGTSASYRYDRCGRLVEHTDPTGATTRIQRDRAGRVVHVTHPMGSTFSYEYDACGRRSATIDTDGSHYGFVYDADGRLVRELWPSGEEAWLRYDACGRVVERFEPGRGTTQHAYDAAGRLVRTTDAWHGRRRFRYDAAGQLVEAVDALGGVTRFEHDALGRTVAVVDPLGGRSRRTFDAVGRVVAETDPLGRTTRFAYDAAGRVSKRVDPTGSELAWTYDGNGRLSETLADGRVVRSVERDYAARTVRLRAGDSVTELTWDATGRLVRRLHGAIGLSWSYDADGRRSSFTGVHGEQTRYEHDAAGRVSAVHAPGVGRMVVERDAIGRVVSMAGPGLHASWTWRGGAVTRLEVHREGTTEVTEVERDEAGRVVAEVHDGLRTAYAYDPAGQLVEVRRGGSVTTYAYDAGGRLVEETVDGLRTSFRYDAAGQLLQRRDLRGTTDLAYDAAGRRIREVGPDGERRFAWDPQGLLASITTITHADDRVVARTQRLTVDALGELAAVDDQPVVWDSAAAVPSLVQVGAVGVTGYGPLTALLPEPSSPTSDADGWIAPSWRPGSTGADPWDTTSGAIASGLPDGLAVGGGGSLLVGGLEWMQARVYDPASRGFLSTDPLNPVPGSGWAGNPYSFAGNDPRNASDPWGLRPVTDAELQAYRDSNNGTLRNAASAATSWVKDNWEYIAAGALIVGGVLVMATGVGGPIGAAMIGGALMSGGLSAGMQKHENGSVDWGRVGVDAAIGGVAGLAGGGAGVAVARSAARSGMNCLGRNVITGAAAGAAEGGTSGALSYATSGQPMTVDGFARATLGGAAMGGGGGALAGGVLTKVSGSACFVAGTQVLLADGTSKAIEDVEVGDLVLAGDPDSGERAARAVVDTYVHEDVETYAVETSTGTVTSTAEHPFWVEGRGWTPVRELQPGDKLVDADGVRVELVSVTATGQTATVHNLNVEGLHSYHVGAGDSWVLVHNQCTTDGIDSPLWTSTSSRSSAQNALQHYNSHGADFPHLNNSLEYVGEAQNFLKNPGPGVQSITRTNGDVVRFDSGTDQFGVVTPSGAPRTYYKPDPATHGYPTNQDYFDAQGW